MNKKEKIVMFETLRILIIANSQKISLKDLSIAHEIDNILEDLK